MDFLQTIHVLSLFVLPLIHHFPRYLRQYICNFVNFLGPEEKIGNVQECSSKHRLHFSNRSSQNNKSLVASPLICPPLLEKRKSQGLTFVFERLQEIVFFPSSAPSLHLLASLQWTGLQHSGRQSPQGSAQNWRKWSVPYFSKRAGLPGHSETRLDAATGRPKYLQLSEGKMHFYHFGNLD